MLSDKGEANQSQGLCQTVASSKHNAGRSHATHATIQELLHLNTPSNRELIPLPVNIEVVTR